MTNKNEGTSWDLLDDPSLDPETKENIVRDTTAEVAAAPILGLITAMPGGIEASERRGQDQFVASDILPTEIRDLYVPNQPMEKGSGRMLLKSWGFTFGKVDPNDPMFTQARLPPGWKKKGSDHDMWSYVVDDKGRERCAIFYKAAFYDRSAHLDISARYRCDLEWEDMKTRSGRARGLVKEGETALFTGEWRSNPTEGSDYDLKYGAYDAAQKDAREWHKANIPEGLAEQWARP